MGLERSRTIEFRGVSPWTTARPHWLVLAFEVPCDFEWALDPRVARTSELARGLEQFRAGRNFLDVADEEGKKTEESKEQRKNRGEIPGAVRRGMVHYGCAKTDSGGVECFVEFSEIPRCSTPFSRCHSITVRSREVGRG